MGNNVHSAQGASIGAKWQWDDVPRDRTADPARSRVLASQAEALVSRYRWSEAIPGLENTPSSRLARLRHERGYDCAADAARAMGCNPTTYQHHENGTRGISNLAADRYGLFFKVAPSLILYGETAPNPALRVPVVGAVGALGRIVNRMDIAYPLPETVPAPPGVQDGLRSLVVLEDDLVPAYRAGDVVFFAHAGPTIDVKAIAGVECVVETETGEQLLCLCEPSPRGTWTLRTYRGKAMRNVRLVSAVPVQWVQRNGCPLPG